MRNFRYWLVIILKTIISAATFAIVSFFLNSCEVKADTYSRTPTTYNLCKFEGTDYWNTRPIYSSSDSYYSIHDYACSQYGYRFELNKPGTYNLKFSIQGTIYYDSFTAPPVTINGRNLCTSTVITRKNPNGNYIGPVVNYECNDVKIDDTTLEIRFSPLYNSSLPSTTTMTYGWISALIVSLSSVGIQEDINQSIKDTQDTIKDSNTDEAQDSASGFFNGFDNNDHGLSGIITAPLTLIQKFNSDTCNSIKLDFKGTTTEIPCGSYLFDRPGFSQFLIVYNSIVGGLICYGAFKGIRKKVEDFKNPDDSKVEVLDL